MSEKTEQLVLTFNTTHDAISAEKYCKENGIDARLIPVPRIISASCGMALKAALSEDERLKAAVSEGQIRTSGTYRLIL